jgi:hypothetical protein
VVGVVVRRAGTINKYSRRKQRLVRDSVAAGARRPMGREEDAPGLATPEKAAGWG